ncbi:MAG: HAD-IIIC family phosphatase [Clostridiales Family XIII bacterium]|jgi:FkbH-like protein|nr:HAD-IIIC family phosphatase [Clostridiales Family XIII bacterium]
MKFSELKKQLKKDVSGFPEIRLAVLGDSATQMLAMALQAFGAYRDINLNVFNTDYNQIEYQLYDPSSEVYAFRPDYILIFISAQKLYESYCDRPLNECGSFAADTLSRIQGYWDSIATRSGCKILQYLPAERDDRIFGNHGVQIKESFIYQMRSLNMGLMRTAEGRKDIHLIDLAYIQNAYGRSHLFDEKMYYAAKLAIRLDALPDVAALTLDTIEAIRGKTKKCVVLDLDNTLWGGVIGDDGLNAIELGELGRGHAFSEFQCWLKKLKERGILLTVCSKNEEAAAKEPFEKHADMVLRLTDISMFVANWQDKAGNIRMIQETLNIGMDSLVFIDDNPVERDLVRSMIPEITVPELPEDPSDYVTFLTSLNLFETPAYTDADGARTEQYRAEADRTVHMREHASIDEYLQSLEMIATTTGFTEFNIPRAAQLSQRSNQFNLCTVRYTAADAERIAADPKYFPLTFSLRDKFGDYGLISVLILRREDEDTFYIENWFMSCRVLKRGMEEFIINTAVETARNAGGKRIIGAYLPTQKNKMVEHIYDVLGFEHLSEGRYAVRTDAFVPNKTFICEDA